MKPESSIWKFSKKCHENDNNSLSARQHCANRKLREIEKAGREPGPVKSIDPKKYQPK